MELKYCEITTLNITARPGAAIGECFREGLMIAIDKWNNVELRHNGRRYKITINKLIETIKEIND